jgi:UDP-glucose 6-dehydrogenase
MKLDNVVRPLLEQKSGKEEGKQFGICMNPEFMRESTAIHDFYHPLFTIIGTSGNRFCLTRHLLDKDRRVRC